ncbi:MAG TPA: toll/interleukin-1 receptor domain-containing protein, partial [Longimicrobiaceae bacterium]
MPGVFLSYNRQDASDFAVLLYAWLAERFGPGHVFWDREGIRPGQEFPKELERQLRDCEALIALIGPAWTPSEWITREIGSALRRKVLVLPVLIGDRPHLERDGLPAAIRRLASLQTLDTRDLRFRQLLMETLEGQVTSAPGEDRSATP